MFSRRVPHRLTPNRLATRVAELRKQGVPLLDLTTTNPTTVEISYPPGLLDALATPAAGIYAPQPFGSMEARRAVASDYQRRGVDLPAERIVLTASTSEAYAFLLKLLCDAADEVLVPRPSYPLFEHLTRLEAVTAVSYPLVYTGSWHIDRTALEQRLTPRTRALVVVSPNNPTGSLLGRDETAWLIDLCRSRGLALILDEVFADYVLHEPEGSRSSALLSQTEALAFGLGGLSKTVGLPQLKLAWLGAGGPSALVAQALARLEVICDTYLSVSTPVQCAVGGLLAGGEAVRREIRERLRRNSRILDARVEHSPACSVLPVEGGWSAVVRVPATCPEETLVLELLEEQHLLVHPGFFYDFSHEAFVVISLLPGEHLFEEGCVRLFRALNTRRDRVPLQTW
ncbi:MAG: aminotransferase class I/II-fold pyridoxal phosphate-dependent enzyme [Luteitalea sp.]|nr:aminotransferase class I/II-fold pyridoxal phosphate-dependent enzyme [Luteitalea sp.]